MSSSAIYQLARFTVLSTALTAGAGDAVEDAEVFAWEAGLFPLFHPNGLSESLSDQFDIPKTELQGFMKAIDERWLARENPTFYTLENDYNWREGDFWTRLRMINALRYAFLSRRFSEDFFSNLLVKGEHPVEASLIVDDFERSNISY